MTFYNEKQKQELIEAVKKKAIELENLFVADNLRMIGCDEHNNRMMCKNAGIKYEGTDCGFLASCVASDMEGINGGSWQWHTDEVIELITEEYENMNIKIEVA